MAGRVRQGVVGLGPQESEHHSRNRSTEMQLGEMRDQVMLLRSARPESGEGLLFARYLDQAAEGFFGFMLGPNSKSITASAFMEPGHGLSYEHVMFAERKDAVVGSLLMDDVEARGRAAGSTRLSLDVAAKNMGARKLYRRRGIIEFSEWPSSPVLPTVLVCMTKQL